MNMSMWDERYAEAGFAYGLEPNEFLASQAAAFPAGGRLVSWGEGEGRNALYLAGRGLRMTALDLSDVGLAKARQRATQLGLALATVAGDLTAYDLGRDAWDGIVSIWCHMPSAVRKAAHAKVLGALKPGGLFLLEAYTPAQLKFGTGGPKDLDMLADLAELKLELPGLEWLVAQELERDVQEGKYHAGRSAVVQLLGRKPAAGA